MDCSAEAGRYSGSRKGDRQKPRGGYTQRKNRDETNRCETLTQCTEEHVHQSGNSSNDHYKDAD
jgi:hypothetical protein